MARPTFVLEAALASNPDDPISVQVWTDLTSRLDVRAAPPRISRGRPDENGEVVPSQLSVLLDNSDGALTPGRAGSPYYPNLVSGKRVRLGLMWPGAGKQLWPNDPSFEGTTSFGWGAVGGASITGAFYGGALHGGRIMLVTWGANTLNSSQVVSPVCYGLVPGRTYTASVYVFVPSGSVAVGWKRFGAFPATNSTTTGAWQRLAVTWVATAASQRFTLWTAAASTAGQAVYVDAVQLEEGAAATAFEPTAGTFTWRFTGDVDEWPLAWQGGPALKAVANLTATDRLKKLGDLGEYQSFLKEDVLDDSPLAYYPLDEPAGSTSGGDISGNGQPPLTIGQVGSGGSVTFGWDHTDGAQDYAVPDFYWDRTTGVRFLPSQLGTPVTAAYPQGQYLRATLAAPITTAGGAAVVCYAYYPGAGSSDFGPIAFLTAADGSYLGIHRSVFGGITAIFVNKADGQGGYPYEVTVPVGSRYNDVLQFAAVLTVTAGTAVLRFVCNGSDVDSVTAIPLAQQPAWNQVTVGGRDKTVDGVGRVNVSHVQVYDYPLPTSPLAVQWYVSMQGRDTFASADTTTARLKKLLQFRGLSGGTPNVPLVESGGSPALIGPQEVEGNPLSAIRLVEATEDGVFFIGGDGLGEWQTRSYRFNAAPALSLAADRLDPDALSYRGDAYGLVNDVTYSRPDGATARAVNMPSVNASGRRRASEDALSQSDSDLRALAAWRANTFGVQRNRITGVKISLLNDPALIPAALTLDIGSKIAVSALPPQAVAASAELFVEGWDEVIGEEEWSMSFSTSPAEVANVWQIGVAGRSEIGTTTRIGY